MSLLSSSSTGLSFSSLFAIECITSGWTLEVKTWCTFIVPTVLLVLAWVVHALPKRSNLNVPVLKDEWLQARTLGVILFLLYLLAFPCASTALSVLSCTDWREQADLGMQYLSAYPYIQCGTQEWYVHLFLPGFLASLFWCIAFPIASTYFVRHLKQDLLGSKDAHSSVGRRVPYNTHSTHWPLVGEVLVPYRTDYWYWEQILLGRRLMLAFLLSFIPSYSIYLSLLLLLLIQCSALLQHYAAPYSSALYNKLELLSLYLLLINYITAVIFRAEIGTSEGDSGGESESFSQQQSSTIWSVVLLIVNIAYLLLLIANMFLFFQRKVKTVYARFGHWWQDGSFIKRSPTAHHKDAHSPQPHSPHPSHASSSSSIHPPDEINLEEHVARRYSSAPPNLTLLNQPLLIDDGAKYEGGTYL